MARTIGNNGEIPYKNGHNPESLVPFSQILAHMHALLLVKFMRDENLEWIPRIGLI